MYRTYTADSFYLILKSLGGKNMIRYDDMVNPPKIDNRDPHTIAMERAAKLGLKVVS